jgi:hypothetical protein
VGGRRVFLTIGDVSGSSLGSQEATDEELCIRCADALIFLFDPVSVRNTAVDVLGRITDALRASHGVRSRERVTVPMAVVVSMFDRFVDSLGPHHRLLRPTPQAAAYDEAEGEFVHEYLRAMLCRRWMGEDLDTHLRLNYTTFRYLRASALGYTPADNMVEFDRVRPFEVASPVRWLFTRLLPL